MAQDPGGTGSPASRPLPPPAPAPVGDLRRQTSLFFSSGDAARPGRITAIGVVPGKGTGPGRLKEALATAWSC
ncbi:hypothetical protein [Streptomyces enissocaesilis]